MQIKSILFDLGKVLLDFDFDPFYKWIEKNSNKKKSEVIQYLLKNQLLSKFESGIITEEEFFSYLKNFLKVDVSLHFLQKLWNEIFNPIQENLELLYHLYNNKDFYQLKIFLLSNTNVTHKEYIEKKYSFFNVFDECFFSYQIYLQKPDKRIYYYVLNKIGYKPEEVVFIDDKIENVVSAKKIGMHTIHYQPATKIEKELKKNLYIRNFSI